MANEHNQLIGFKVYDAQRSIYKSLETALAPLGITPGQFNLLNQLDRAGELSQKALAERTRKEQATITRYLDLLERKGSCCSHARQSRRRSCGRITDESARCCWQPSQCSTEQSAWSKGVDRKISTPLPCWPFQEKAENAGK